MLVSNASQDTLHKNYTTFTSHKNIRWEEVVFGELQVVIIAKLSEDSPGGLMATSLDEQSVEKEETPQCEGVVVNPIRYISSNYRLQLLEGL